MYQELVLLDANRTKHVCRMDVKLSQTESRTHHLGIRGSVLLAGPLGSGAAARPAPPDRVHRRDRGPVDEITALQLMG